MRFLAARTLAVGALAACILPCIAPAQAPLFSDSTEIAFTIEAPLRELVRRAERNTDPYAATLTLSGAESQSFPIELSARGLSRRTRGFCDFPPLRLDFDKDALEGTLFEGQNRLKLVTHCRPSERYEELVALELLVYKLYNTLTDVSFRVRPARITYRYTDRDGREETHFGFLIEDVDDLGDRVGLKELGVAPGEIGASQLDQAAAAQFSLFEFMIGNLDWDMTYGPDPDECCHNSRLLAVDEAAPTAIVSAPYDFDHSGFVDAPYATPPEQVDIDSVRSRYYWGLCAHNAALPGAVTAFQSHRDALFAVIAAETRLPEGEREKARRYVESFYEILDDADRFDRLVVRRCRD